MALIDYRKLCPKSGHALTRDEQAALDAKEDATGPKRTLRCEACGRTVEASLDPGTGRSLVYPMHLRRGAGARPNHGSRPR